MAGNSRTQERVREEILVEREKLAGAVDELRTDLNVSFKQKLPVLAAGALGAGFVISGGIGASMRILARRGREGKEKARVGPFSFVRRR